MLATLCQLVSPYVAITYYRYKQSRTIFNDATAARLSTKQLRCSGERYRLKQPIVEVGEVWAVCMNKDLVILFISSESR